MITLKTLETATAEEVFTQVRDHLLKQGEKSYGSGGCLYRSNGLRCAAGCLIADDEYQPKEMEGEDWEGLVVKGLAPMAHCELISRLQWIHDNYAPHRWERLLREVEL